MPIHAHIRTRLIAAGLLVFALVSAAPLAAAQELKIAVVNLDRLVAQSAAGKALQTRLEQFQQQVQSQGDAMTAAANDLRQQIANGANTLSEERLSELQKELEDKAIEIRRFRDDKQREGQKIQTEGLREIESKLGPIFEAIRAEGNYDLIINNVPGVVVMASERIDITQTVLDRFNAAGN